MKTCALCGKEALIDKHFSRKSSCQSCGGDLYICLNCRFYSETSHNRCLEPKSEFQRSRDKVNFCDYFQYRESAGKQAADNPKEDTRRRFEDLFKKP